jgi:protein-disulfide isomerase
MLDEKIQDLSVTHWYKRWWGIALFGLLTLLLIFLVVFVFYVFGLSKNLKNNSLLLPVSNIKYDKILVEGKNNYHLGSDKAKITIVEFTDFACPFSKSSFPKIREIGLKYKKDVNIIIRDHPYLTEHSIKLAQAARCAGEQGYYWPMHDKLFQNQNVSTETELNGLARQVGADETKFSACLAKEKYLPDIRRDLADAETLALTGTPTWFINGNRIEGDMPLATWEKIIGQFK